MSDSSQQRHLLRVNRAHGLNGTLTVPGDKSISHRALMLGSLARGTTTIEGLLQGADPLATMAIMKQLGAMFDNDGSGVVHVTGTGLDGLLEPDDVLDAANSGTSMRLLLGILAAQPHYCVITGDRSLRSRPMGRVIHPLQQMGASIAARSGNTLAPISVFPAATGLHGTTYTPCVASAQVKSCLLLAGLFARGRTSVTEPRQSRDHTERMLRAFGVEVQVDGLTVAVEGPVNRLNATQIRVPGDLSSAAFFLVAGTIVPGSELTVRAVGVNPTRTGVLDVLRQMGARITLTNERTWGAEPVADICVESAPLTGTDLAGDLVTRSIDEIPVIAVAAALARGKTRIRDAAELRVKESDRLSTVATELARMGVRVEEQPDGLVIHGSQGLQGADCHSYGDHRIAMAIAVAGLAAKGETTIIDADCIDVSFPGFADQLRALGAGAMVR